MASQFTTLSRRIHFSSGHRYGVPSLSELENRNLFGDLYVAEGLGHNYILEVRVTGDLDPVTGMICDLVELDRCLEQVTNPFDHHFINEDIPEFADKVPTPERLAVYFFSQLEPLLLQSKTHIKGVRVYEGEAVWAEFIDTYGQNEASLTQRVSISCLHRHHNPELSPEENEKLYYKCSRTHGHQYHIEVTMKGEIDEKTGMVFPRSELSRRLDEKLVKVFHGSYLNDHVGNTSGEIILQFFEKQLNKEFPEGQFWGLRLRETRKNHFSTIGLVEGIGESR